MTYHKYATPDEGDWAYADAMPVIEPTWASLASLRQANAVAGSHWFDRDTLAFFGSRGQELIAGCVVVELQSKAPEGMPRYVAVPFRPDATPVGITCRHASRAAARRCARDIAAKGLHVLPESE